MKKLKTLQEYRKEKYLEYFNRNSDERRREFWKRKRAQENDA